MPKKSAGILLYRFQNNSLEVFLVHPGGPFWKNKDLSSWSIPKGEFDQEQPLNAAIREFEEETGTRLSGEFTELTSVNMRSGKIIYCFTLSSDFDAESLRSNTFQLEWPPKSGLYQDFPEVDKGEWFSIETALQKITPSQVPFLNQLREKIL